MEPFHDRTKIMILWQEKRCWKAELPRRSWSLNNPKTPNDLQTQPGKKGRNAGEIQDKSRLEHDMQLLNRNSWQKWKNSWSQHNLLNMNQLQYTVHEYTSIFMSYFNLPHGHMKFRVILKVFSTLRHLYFRNIHRFFNQDTTHAPVRFSWSWDSTEEVTSSQLTSDPMISHVDFLWWRQYPHLFINGYI